MKTKAILFTALVAGALALPVLGTTIPRLDLPTLVARSCRIFQGTVEAIGGEVVTEEGQRRPYTMVRVRVDDPMKSRCRDQRQTVLIRHLGGKLDTARGPVEVSISGMPQFRVGDNVILFLSQSSDGTNHQVVGLNQGKYLVENQVAISNVTGVELVDPTTGKPVPGGYTQSANVEAFKTRIRELVK